MGILVKKTHGIYSMTGMAKLSVIAFIVSIAASLVDTIWAVYMDSFVHSESIVGFISAGLTVVAFASYFIFIPFIEKTNKAKIYSTSLLIFAITYALFAINKKFYIFIILAFLLTILYTFRITSLGIIVKDKSGKKLSRNEGLIYTFTNTAWVVGPLIAGYVAENYGINLVFTLAAIFVFLAFLLFKFSRIRDAHIKKRTDNHLSKNFIDFFKNKHRAIAYFLSGGVNFWWVLIYLFIPIHIIRSGLSDLWIGYFLFAVAVPLILTEYKFSQLAGKRGFKRMFKIGFLFASIVSLTCFFVGNIYILLGLLVLASFGVAMIEPTTEAYFFDISNSKEATRFYGPYNTSIDLNQFLAKISAATLLIFFPFKYIFLLFSLFMFLMFMLSFKIKNIIEDNR